MIGEMYCSQWKASGMVSRLTKRPPKIITGRIASGITCNSVRNELDLLSRWLGHVSRSGC